MAFLISRLYRRLCQNEKEVIFLLSTFFPRERLKIKLKAFHSEVTRTPTKHRINWEKEKKNFKKTHPPDWREKPSKLWIAVLQKAGQPHSGSTPGVCWVTHKRKGERQSSQESLSQPCRHIQKNRLRLLCAAHFFWGNSTQEWEMPECSCWHSSCSTEWKGRFICRHRVAMPLLEVQP